jgi:hypothetical protein
VVVHIDAEALASGQGSGELAAGGVLPAGVVRKLACDARIETVVEAGDGAVGIGRARRQIPAHLLRYLKKRDGGCRFPGCGRRRHLHAHHIEHWVNGGPTDITNLVMVCSLCGIPHKGHYELCVARDYVERRTATVEMQGGVSPRSPHNHSASRKARRPSVGRNRPGAMSSGVVLAIARSLIDRSACR